MTVKVNSVTKGDWFNYHYLQEVFPTALYARQSIMTAEENDILIKKITELREIFNEGDTTSWLSGKYSPDNCFHIADLNKYLEFEPLIKRVKLCVEEFALAYGSEAEYNCYDAWYNVYESGKYQEFHTHSHSIFSAVYFVQIPKGSPGIYFKRPEADCMLPPKSMVRPSKFQQSNIIAPPEERAVVIFRSNIEHSVPPLTFDGERITIALNFD